MVDADGNIIIMTPAPTSSPAPTPSAWGPEDQERAALMDIYNTMGGTGWTRVTDGWGVTADHCDWAGVDCDDDGNVVELDLHDNGLTGGE